MPVKQYRSAVIALVAGVILNVAIAWLVAETGPLNGKELEVESKRWPIRVPANWARAPDLSSQSRTIGSTFVYYLGFEDDDHSRPSAWLNSGVFSLREQRSGWPFRALTQYEGFTSGKGRFDVLDLGQIYTGVALLREPNRTSYGIFGLQPIMPLWPGFIGNTFLYGSIPWLLMFALTATKRRRRARRGLCIACAYPIAGVNICPECGNAHPAASGLHALDRQTLSLPMSQSDGDEPDGTSA